MNEDPKTPAPPVLSDPDGGHVPAPDRERSTDSRVPEGGVAGHGGSGQERDLGGVQGARSRRFTIPGDLTDSCANTVIVATAGVTVAFAVPPSIALAIVARLADPNSRCEPLIVTID